MKTYRKTSQDGVFYDVLNGFSFVDGSPNHAAMLAEMKAGAAVLDDAPGVSYAEKRLSDYRINGLTPEGWLEPVIEFLGTLPNKPEKFAALWEKREAIRSAYPKN